MTVDTEQDRLAAINGHLVEDVKFGGGLLEHLGKGSSFEVRQAEIAPGQWEMTVLCVDMKGKGSALQDNQRAGDRKSQRLHRVADDLTLVEAASILDGQTAVVDNR